ncbi:hypothetical protein [Streptomyces sioyaensis]|uniref:hypothetical protein n=1 Tax=Streptomyces sioyaensis TaxID=67364 RepID=UPI0037887CCF
MRAVAGRMVRDFGMSSALGPVGYAAGPPQHLGGEPPEETLQRPYSEQTQRIIDEEAARLVREAEKRAVALLGEHRKALEALAALLVTHETVAGSVVLDVLREQQRTGDGDATAAGNPTARS